MTACGLSIRVLTRTLLRSEKQWASRFCVGVTLAIAGVSWLRHRLWGWRLAVAIIAIQVLSNVVHILLGRAVEGLIGGIVAGALLFYLLRPTVHAAFKG